MLSDLTMHSLFLLTTITNYILGSMKYEIKNMVRGSYD